MSTVTDASTTRRRMGSRDLALVAVFAGVMAALGLLPKIDVPWSPAPVTAQSLAVMLAGAIIGARRGFASMLLFLALVAIGLPVLAGGRGGLGVFAGPTAGFLAGYLLCPVAIGWLTERAGAPYHWGKGIVINIIGGIVLMDVFGALGFMATLHLSPRAAIVACGPFLPGDLTKAVIAALVAHGVHRAYPGLLASRRG